MRLSMVLLYDGTPHSPGRGATRFVYGFVRYRRAARQPRNIAGLIARQT